MHHKRKKPKHQRAGCLMCKPHKDNRGKNSKGACTRQELKADNPNDLLPNDYIQF